MGLYTVRLCLLVLGLLTCLGNLQAAVPGNWLDEQRQAEHLAKAYPATEAIRLQNGAYEFLALHRPASGRAKLGAVILLPDIGAHADWPDVIEPLRTELPAAGWATLSLQLAAVRPRELPAQAQDLVDDSAGRLRAALDFLARQGHERVILIGHGLGASLGARFLGANADNRAVKGFIGIGMEVDDRAESPLAIITALQQIRLPVLDIFGAQDLPAVLQTADRRRQAATQTEGADYRQIELPAADHHFIGSSQLLVARISAWLRARFAEQKSANKR